MADPALFDPRDPALRLAAGALEKACGTAPALVRIGGTLPLLAVLAERGITSIVSGFALPEDAFHAPNESYRLESLRLGEAAARELYVALAGLPVSARPGQVERRPGPAGAAAARCILTARAARAARGAARASGRAAARSRKSSAGRRPGSAIRMRPLRSTRRGSSSSSCSTLRGS